jgi:hypothetical protein
MREWMPVCMRFMVVLKELLQLKILRVSSMDISLIVALEPWREMEHPKGLDDRVRGSFIFFV